MPLSLHQTQLAEKSHWRRMHNLLLDTDETRTVQETVVINRPNLKFINRSVYAQTSEMP